MSRSVRTFGLAVVVGVAICFNPSLAGSVGASSAPAKPASLDRAHPDSSLAAPTGAGGVVKLRRSPLLKDAGAGPGPTLSPNVVGARMSSRPGVVRNGVWLLRDRLSGGVNTVPSFVYGRPGDVPVMGDWDGNGTKTPGVVRIVGSANTLHFRWFLRNSNTGGPANVTFTYGRPSFGFEEPGDVPIVGDWNGDGVDTPGVVRFRNGRTNAVWLLKNTNAGGTADVSFGYGRLSDGPPVSGDWNADGTDSPGIIRGFGADTLTWLLRNGNSAGPAEFSAAYGRDLDKPIAGDWNGDGIDGLGINRPIGSGLGWLLRQKPTSGSAEVSFTYGRAHDLPLVWSAPSPPG